MTRKLPVLVEQALADASAARQQAVFNFDQKVLSEVRSVSCRPGCSNCCRHPVLISVLEGIELFRWLADQHLWDTKMKEDFAKAHERTWGLALEVWALSDTPCPLLKDNLCQAYKARPYSCRVTYSTGDPYDCHPHRLIEARGLIPRRAVHAEVEKAEGPILKRHQVPFLRLPLASAVLLGEKIVRGEIELEDAMTFVAEQNLKQQED